MCAHVHVCEIQSAYQKGMLLSLLLWAVSIDEVSDCCVVLRDDGQTMDNKQY